MNHSKKCVCFRCDWVNFNKLIKDRTIQKNKQRQITHENAVRNEAEYYKLEQLELEGYKEM